MSQSEEIRVVKVATAFERRAYEEICREVFVSERKISEGLIFDGKDEQSHQFLLFIGEEPVVAARIMLDEKSKKAWLGRFAVRSNFRLEALARKMVIAIESHDDFSGVEQFFLASQSYIVPLYESLGYKPEGEEFEINGIPHRTLVKVKNNGCLQNNCG